MCIKSNDLNTIKQRVMTGAWQIDDPTDIYSKHTLLMDAVIMNREEVFTWLLGNGANPMCRDQNGYTVLLKAAALGRMEMCKALIEETGVDPRHLDPFGNTAREKALLH